MSIQDKFIFVFLKIVDSHPDGITTKEVKKIIEMTYPFNPSDLDAHSSTGRPRWSQIVNNLKSNNILEGKGFASLKDGKWTITNFGKQYIEYAQG